MKSVLESPYECDESAEAGESVFEQFLRFLEPCSTTDGSDGSVSGGTIHSGVSAATTKLFCGITLARSIVRARIKMEATNEAYESEWKLGNISGEQMGYIPPIHLLMCLPDRLFASPKLPEGNDTHEEMLRKIVQDLNVHVLVKNAMVEWMVEDEYTNLSTCEGPFTFSANKSRYDRCAIFVARTYQCTKLLKWTNINMSLQEKIHDCLLLMDVNINGAVARPGKQKYKTLVPKIVPTVGSLLFQTNQEEPPRTINVGPQQLESYSPSPGTRSSPVENSLEHVPETHFEKPVPSKNPRARPCSDKWATRESMETIVTSPYEKDSTAEIAEKAFDRLAEFLTPLEASGSRRSMVPSNVAMTTLGMDLAMSLTLTHHHIAISGQIYCELWKDGLVRAVNCGSIPTPMMLLCLQGARLSRAPRSVLKMIIRHLEVGSIVKEAMAAFQLENAYVKLTSSSASFVYASTNETQCLKCEIFVARAYSCMAMLHIEWKKDSLIKKVMESLQIMSDNIQNQKSAVPFLKQKLTPRSADLAPFAGQTDNAAFLEPSWMPQNDDTTSSEKIPPPALDVAVSRHHTSKINHSGKRKFEEEPPSRQFQVSRPRESLLAVEPGPKRTARTEKGQNNAKSDISVGASKKLQGSLPLDPSNAFVPIPETTRTDESVIAVPNSAIRSLFPVSKTLPGTSVSNYGRRGSAETPNGSNGDHVCRNSGGAENSGSASRQAAHMTPCSQSPGTKDKQVSPSVDMEWSPYEKGYNAENEEKAFIEMANLLRPMPNDGFRRRLVASSAAIKFFGSELAGSLAATSSAIKASGMIFAGDFIEGRIRGVASGSISKPMLLLCLQTDTIATRALNDQRLAMEAAVRRLELWSIVKESLTHWQLEKTYTNLAASLDNITFTSNKLQCQKCLIFVARAFSCIKVLKRPAEDSLSWKVRACLRIMDKNAGESSPRSKQKVCDGSGLLQKSGATGDASTGVCGPLLNAGLESMDNQAGEFPPITQTTPCGPNQNSGVPAQVKKSRATNKGPNQVRGRPCQAVEKVCLQTGKVLDRFASTVLAVRSLTVCHEELSQVLNGQRPSARGFFWRYAGSSITPPGSANKSPQPSAPPPLATSTAMNTLQIANSSQATGSDTKHRGPVHILLKHLGGKGVFPSSNPAHSSSVADTAVTQANNVVDLSNPDIQTDRIAREEKISTADRLLQQVDVKPKGGQCYPHDDNIILNATEVEMAWLCEESIYCLQQKEVHWPFIYKYASLSLQMKLRKEETNVLERVVRFDNVLVARRFPIMRRVIRRKMHNGEFRPRMQNVIAQLRLAGRRLGIGRN
jgi:hypothetical protein